MRVSLAVMGVAMSIAAGCHNSGSQGECGGQRTDVQSDPSNCGACGKTCPTPLHAAAVCTAGTCGQGPCDPGWWDLDASVPGCEAGGEGVTAQPLPATGMVFQAFAAGSSYGDRIQVNGEHTNVGVLGEPTPPAVRGFVSETSAAYQNIGGLSAIQH